MKTDFTVVKSPEIDKPAADGKIFHATIAQWMQNRSTYSIQVEFVVFLYSLCPQVSPYK